MLELTELLVLVPKWSMACISGAHFKAIHVIYVYISNEGRIAIGIH